MFKALLEALKKLGIVIPAEKEKEVNETLESLEKQHAPKPQQDPPKKDGDEMPAWAKALQQQNEALATALANEQKAREESVKSFQEQQKQQRAKEIKDLVEASVKVGRITPKDSEKWTKRLEANFDGTKEILSELPENPALAKSQQKPDGGDKNKSTSQVTPEGAILDMAQLRDAAADAFRASAKE